MSDSFAGLGSWSGHLRTDGGTDHAGPSPGARARGLPGDRVERAHHLHRLARRDAAAGRLGSAEVNLKLALTFDPTNPEYWRDLESVSEERRALRRRRAGSR